MPPVKPNDVPIAAVLSDFTIVVTSDDANAIDEAQLTTTLQDYLAAGMRDVYRNVEAVRLQPQQLRQRRKLQQSSTVKYTGNVVFLSTASSSSVQDVQSLEEELLLDLSAVQVEVDRNSVIGPNVRVEEVTADDNSAVALSGFTVVVTGDDNDPVDKAQLTKTLEDYLTAGLIQDYSNLEAVMLQPQQMQQGDIVLFSGYALFSGSAPSFFDVQSLEKELLSDTSAVQTAVDSSLAIGQNGRVAGVVFDESLGESLGDGDYDDNTAAIVGGVVGASAFGLVLVAILMTRRKNDSDDDKDEEPPLVSRPRPQPPPLPLPLPRYAALDAEGSIGVTDAVDPISPSDLWDHKDELRLFSLLIAKHAPLPMDSILDAEGSIGSTDTVDPRRSVQS
jgi:hypothetical protein